MFIRIKKLRKKHKLSEEDLAKYLNISVSLYIAYESGKKKIPIQILSALSVKYNTSIDYLIENTDDITPHKRINF